MSTYRIPEPRLATLTENVAALNKRAERNGLMPVTLTIGAREPQSVKVDGRIVVRMWVNVEVSGAPVLVAGGWQFWASLQSCGDEIITAAPWGHDVPAEFREVARARMCDHCKADRRRIDTYVLKSADGSFRVVGSTCLQDFIGADRDAEAMAAAFQLWLNMEALCSEASEDSEGAFSGRPDYVDVSDVLAFAAADALARGYVSKGKAEADMVISTVSVVMTALFPRPGNHPIERTGAGDMLASDALTWGKARFIDGSPDTLADFERNLRAVLSDAHGMVQVRHIGLACALIPAFSRDLMARRLADIAKGSTYQGTIGDRVVLTLTLQKIYTYTTDFGAVNVHTMTDASGNVYVWKASGAGRVDVDGAEWSELQTLTVKGSIKAHSEFRGVRQTVLTRVARHVEAAPKVRKPRKTGGAALIAS